jgi:O-antigen/teichoic acid export membrane protein
MSNTIRISTITQIERLGAHLRIPLYRNGYALVMNSGLTAALGMLFWLLAARTYTTETVGLNAAAISTMMALSRLAQLDMSNVANRFLPNAGRMTGQMILCFYGICAGLALVVGTTFILGIKWWTPELAHLKSSPWMGAAFVAATLLWTVFAIQDGVLVGLREATWVPVENAIFALAKVGLLVPLVAFFPDHGIFVSWTLPVVLLVVAMNWLIFRRLVPHHVQKTQDISVRVLPSQIARYITGDYFSSLIGLFVNSLMPLIIVAQLGAAANAYFTLAWTIHYSLYLVSLNMGMSLIAEAVIAPDKLYRYMRQTLIQLARLLVPAVLAIVVAAPYFLPLFGEGYAEEGAGVLRLLCLSVIPSMVNTLYISVARVKPQVKTLLVIQAAIYLQALALTLILLPNYGLVGVGWAWLISQSTVAILLSTGALWRLGCPSLLSLLKREEHYETIL